MLGDVLLLVVVLVVLVFVSVLSWSDGSDLGLAFFLSGLGHHTGETFDFLKLYDTLEFVL